MLNSPKRLAIIMPGFFEQMIGGSEYQAYLLAHAAKRKGLDVHYIFISNSNSFSNHLDLHLHVIKPVCISKRFGATRSVHFAAVHHLLEDIRPDVVYVRGGSSFSGMAVLYARKRHCKSIWHVAHVADVTPRSIISLVKRPFDIIERKAVEYAIRNSTHVVAHARSQADLLMRHYGRSAEVILKEQPEPQEEMDKNGLFTVVWVANIKSWKQPEMFVRLAGELRHDDRVRFIMIGRPAGGEYQKKLEASMVGLPNLEYRGERPIEEVNQLLAKAHIFINTSTKEGLPNTFVQAWLREVPVVSMLWDPDGILKPGNVGRLSGSFDQMVADIRMLIENPGLRDEMGKRAREYALENHSLTKNMGRLLELIMAE